MVLRALHTLAVEDFWGMDILLHLQMRKLKISEVPQLVCGHAMSMSFKAPVLGHDAHPDKLGHRHLKMSRNQRPGSRRAMTNISAVPSPGFPSKAWVVFCTPLPLP